MRRTATLDVTAVDVFREIEGESYDAYNCWAVARHCYERLLGRPLSEHLSEAVRTLVLREVWFAGPGHLLQGQAQPWDLLIFRVKSLASDHVGIVLTPDLYGTSTPARGVHKAHISTSMLHLLQIARLAHREES